MVVGKIEQLTETRTVAIEELIPWTDERPLTEELLLELDFEKMTIIDKHEGDVIYYHTTHQQNPVLIADLWNGKWEVRMQEFEQENDSMWNTYGTVKMLMMCLQGDADVREMKNRGMI